MAWISLCGILDGSPTVDWLLRSRLREMFYRGLFRWRGLRLEALTGLRRTAGSPLIAPLELPPTMRLMRIVGFPRRRHLGSRLARRCHAAASSEGPNDGAVLLSDVVHGPGVVYPVWGADHHLRPSWELRKLGRAVLRFALERAGTRKIRCAGGRGRFVTALSRGSIAAYRAAIPAPVR